MKIINFRKTETKLNKCDYCDLQRTIQPTTQKEVIAVDKWFGNIDELYKAKLIPHKYSKAILIPENTTLYCLINSKYWHTKKKKCPYWQATVGSTPSGALSLYYTRATTLLTAAIYLLTGLLVCRELWPIAYKLSEMLVSR
jgi:hypothetical protein